jgi:hypothetical protein
LLLSACKIQRRLAVRVPNLWAGGVRRSQMPTVVLPMNPVPATAVCAAACKISAELPPHVLIMAISMTIVGAINPNIPPAMAIMPRGAVTSRCVCMAAVPGFPDAPLATLVRDGGRGLCLLGNRRRRSWLRCGRRCRRILFARLRLGLRNSGGRGEHNQ